MLRHRYTENYQDIPFSEISRKLNACALQCVPGVPPRPSSKLELERLGTRLTYILLVLTSKALPVGQKPMYPSANWYEYKSCSGYSMNIIIGSGYECT